MTINETILYNCDLCEADKERDQVMHFMLKGTSIFWIKNTENMKLLREDQWRYKHICHECFNYIMEMND